MNPILIIIIIFTSCTQFIFVQYGGTILKCSPLSLHFHVICILLGSFSLVVNIFSKIIMSKLFKKCKDVL